jgi:hypothetical protein
MKYVFFLLIIVASLVSNAQIKTQINFVQPANSPTKDTIYFTNAQPLVWKDFKGLPQQKGMAIAETASGFGFNAGFKMINNKGTLKVNIFCYFDKTKSWVKPGSQSNYALQHEQNHFTISYIATNYFYQQLKIATFTRSNYNQLLNEIYNASIQKLREMQNQYDSETRNGINKEQQAKWNKKINEQLNLLAIR